MSNIYIGDSRLRRNRRDSASGMVERNGERYYRITDYDRLPPFFMTVVSGWDHWMFVSSTGGLTCGRRGPDNALFPYTTDDKIHDAHSNTGPATCLRVSNGGKQRLWRPFAYGPTVYCLQRNLYKNRLGNKLLFEEINEDLGLTFSHMWTTSERFGFVRKVSLHNTGAGALQVEVLDGLRNILPWGVDKDLQANMSTLVDAYKCAESIEGLPAALYSLSSIMTDRAEPSEALKCTVVSCLGLETAAVLLSEDQLMQYRLGAEVVPEARARGKRGAFMVNHVLQLDTDEARSWYMVADVEQSSSDVQALLKDLRNGLNVKTLESDIERGSSRLRRLLGKTDGFQASADDLSDGRHLSNSLFNIMRGGVFDKGYRFPIDDFLQFVDEWHPGLSDVAAGIMATPDGSISLSSAVQLAGEHGDPDLQRLVLEYLPLTFSRRHGDPSRPWNKYSIEVRNPDGSNCLNYQGNWRDIFQNWEALALSYPGFIESFIGKFVNASTIDGYNAYRISRDGFEWEVLDADDPWSNIGYWGDHQVGYLYRLLQLSANYHPGRLTEYLDQDLFVYADVPYRLKPYASKVRDPRNTIEYDNKRASRIEARAANTGADGKLVHRDDNTILRVNLLEKLLVPALAKISNLVPGGGIWMNTQRPEWNDANNALVGHGLSMVTLCYLRRYLECVGELLPDDDAKRYLMTSEVVGMLECMVQLLSSQQDLLQGQVSDQQRKHFMDAFGACSDRWHASIYDPLSGSRNDVNVGMLRKFLSLVQAYLDHSIGLNQREDGLFNAYNLLHFEAEGYGVEPLEVMLEGQVAVLASGYLDAAQSLALLKALFASGLYREDQHSFMLYPDRVLPGFLEKNLISAEMIDGFDWLQAQIDTGSTTYVEQDVAGQLHFNGRFRNGALLKAALQADDSVLADDAVRLCTVYEAVFSHRRFKGRSGSMVKYEGLGCIYWHMVSKLALAVAEVTMKAADHGADAEQLDALAVYYHAIREGIGVHKSPAEYGAFTTDPYSHTPGFAGVQQPGLTGQVKEDFIARFCELGVVVDQGSLCFSPQLLWKAEFLEHDDEWHGNDGEKNLRLPLLQGSVCFTLCGVPIIYRLANEASVVIFETSGSETTVKGNHLGPERSRALFERDGTISRIEVQISQDLLRTR